VCLDMLVCVGVGVVVRGCVCAGVCAVCVCLGVYGGRVELKYVF